MYLIIFIYYLLFYNTRYKTNFFTYEKYSGTKNHSNKLGSIFLKKSFTSCDKYLDKYSLPSNSTLKCLGYLFVTQNRHIRTLPGLVLKNLHSLLFTKDI